MYKRELYARKEEKFKETMKEMPQSMRAFFISLKRVSTKEIYWQHIRGFLQWLIDNRKISALIISDISMEDMNGITWITISEYLDDLCIRKKELDSSTINAKMRCYGSLWAFLMRNDYVQKNVISTEIRKKYALSSKKSGNAKVPSMPDLQEFMKNLNNIPNEHNKYRNIAIVTLFLGSGIRLSALVGLDMEDICYVQAKGEEGGRFFIKVIEKGEVDKYEVIPISNSAAQAIQKYLGYRDKIAPTEENALFLSLNRKRIGRTTIQGIFKKYSEGKINPHLLRHMVASAVYKSSGNNVGVAAQVLGHSNSDVTQKHYINSDNEEIYNIFDIIDESIINKINYQN